MTRRTIKLYGERNTGTRYLGLLIDENLQVEQLPGTAPEPVRALQRALPGKELVRDAYFAVSYRRNLGWKHSLVRAPEQLRRQPVCTPELGFVTLTKNPYSWLLSLHRRPHHQWRSRRLDFETFLESPWHNLRRDNASRSFANPVELWNAKNRAYIALGLALPTCSLRYEDLLEDPEAAIDAAAGQLGIERRASAFVNVERSTKDADKDFAFYRDYYLEERWSAELAPGAIARINRHLSDEVLEHFGYARLASADRQ